MAVGGGEQSKADLAQIVALLLVVTALGEVRGGVGRDVGGKGGAVVGQGCDLDAEAVDGSAGEIALDGVEGGLVEVVRRGPGRLAGEGASGDRPQAAWNGVVIPTTDLCLAPGGDDAVECGKEDQPPDRKAPSAFLGVAIDDVLQVEAVGDGEDGYDGAERVDLGLADGGELGGDVFGLAEVTRSDDAGLSVHTSGFDEVPVLVVADRLADQVDGQGALPPSGTTSRPFARPGRWHQKSLRTSGLPLSPQATQPSGRAGTTPN